MAKSKAGRPTKMTDNVVNKLEQAFEWGCTDAEACVHADISKQTLYDYCKKFPKFTDRKELLKDSPILKAKQIQWDELDKDSINQANRVIDRKEGQKIKQEISGPDGNPIETKVEWHILPVTPIDKADEENP